MLDLMSWIWDAEYSSGLRPCLYKGFEINVCNFGTQSKITCAEADWLSAIFCEHSGVFSTWLWRMVRRPADFPAEICEAGREVHALLLSREGGDEHAALRGYAVLDLIRDFREDFFTPVRRSEYQDGAFSPGRFGEISAAKLNVLQRIYESEARSILRNEMPGRRYLPPPSDLLINRTVFTPFSGTEFEADCLVFHFCRCNAEKVRWCLQDEEGDGAMMMIEKFNTAFSINVRDKKKNTPNHYQIESAIDTLLFDLHFQPRALAFMSAQHARLGAASSAWMRLLPEEVCRMILKLSVTNES
jgi:hypothetical protein